MTWRFSRSAIARRDRVIYSAAFSVSGHGTSLGQFSRNQLDASSRLSARQDLPSSSRAISFWLYVVVPPERVISNESCRALVHGLASR